MTSWNPRFLAYARASGRGPEEQIANDRTDWPGGHMTGFSLWIMERWQDWEGLKGKGAREFLSPDDHVCFDIWLEGYVTGIEKTKAWHRKS